MFDKYYIFIFNKIFDSNNIVCFNIIVFTLYNNLHKMKYTNKIFAALAILAMTPFTYAATLSVNSITAVDANTLKVTLSENQNFPKGEIK